MMSVVPFDLAIGQRGARASYAATGEDWHIFSFDRKPEAMADATGESWINEKLANRSGCALPLAGVEDTLVHCGGDAAAMLSGLSGPAISSEGWEIPSSVPALNLRRSVPLSRDAQGRNTRRGIIV